MRSVSGAVPVYVVMRMKSHGYGYLPFPAVPIYIYLCIWNRETKSLKDESFKQRFVAFAIGAMAISLRKTSPNSARKEAFAKRKLWLYLCDAQVALLMVLPV